MGGNYHLVPVKCVRGRVGVQVRDEERTKGKLLSPLHTACEGLRGFWVNKQGEIWRQSLSWLQQLCEKQGVS